MIRPICSVDDEITFLYDLVPELRKKNVPKEIVEKILYTVKYATDVSVLPKEFINKPAVEIAKQIESMVKAMEWLPLFEDTKQRVVLEVMHFCISYFGYNSFKTKMKKINEKRGITLEDFLKVLRSLGKTKIKFTSRDLVGELFDVLRPFYQSDYEVELRRTIENIIKHTVTEKNIPDVKSRIQEYLHLKSPTLYPGDEPGPYLIDELNDIREVSCSICRRRKPRGSAKQVKDGFVCKDCQNQCVS